MAIGPAQRFRPLRRVEYDKLIELGAFRNERIELLEGALVPMSPIGPPRSSTVRRLTALLVPALAGRATVSVQSPFAALDLSEPEPDIAIIPLGDYDTAHPDRADLIIEVAESSLSIDRDVKQRVYAACNVPEYWIVNLIDRQIEVYTEPKDGIYANSQRFDTAQTLRPTRFPDLEIPVTEVIK